MRSIPGAVDPEMESLAACERSWQEVRVAVFATIAGALIGINEIRNPGYGLHVALAAFIVIAAISVLLERRPRSRDAGLRGFMGAFMLFACYCITKVLADFLRSVG